MIKLGGTGVIVAGSALAAPDKGASGDEGGNNVDDDLLLTTSGRGACDVCAVGASFGFATESTTAADAGAGNVDLGLCADTGRGAFPVVAASAAAAAFDLRFDAFDSRLDFRSDLILFPNWSVTIFFQGFRHDLRTVSTLTGEGEFKTACSVASTSSSSAVASS